MGDAELAQDTRELLGTRRVGLWMKAYLAGKTAEVPEQWRMRDEEFLAALETRPTDRIARMLIARLKRMGAENG